MTRDGQPVAYTGAQVKRPAATDGDYLGSSPARASATWSTSVTSTTSRVRAATRSPTTSRPTISSTRRARRRRARTRLRPTRSASRRQGARRRASRRRLRRLRSRPDAFNACTTAQQSALSAARTQAKAYAVDAATYLGAGTQGPRYTTWFGAATTGALQHRHLAFQRHFVGDAERRHHLRLQQQAECLRLRLSQSAVQDLPRPRLLDGAGVRHRLPGRHADPRDEPLHDVAGTDDVVYGQAGAKSLAISNPDAAITNADSHEYFAENTPTAGPEPASRPADLRVARAGGATTRQPGR